ncbi:hypothetical protein HDU86_007129 [Geranomyces michiganensis]|nr:hypothetical protein HDU86_007129 [Geranomyces michiganensis]
MNAIRLTAAARMVQRRAISSATPATLPSVEKIMLKEAFETRVHSKAAVSSWYKINFFLVIPALLGVAWYSGTKEIDHIKHLIAHPREFEALPYLRKRKNGYPWGDKNLFYFPQGNPGPEGGEEE